MGYSARYHAASLAAVFLALAIGILIGAGLGDDLLSDTEENLRESLEADIEAARGEADDLQGQLDRERAFGDRAYPALVGDTLDGRRIGILALGDLPDSISNDIEDALEPSGGQLASVVVARIPPDVSAIADELGPRFNDLDQEPERLGELGSKIGLQLVAGGGRRLARLRELVFTRSSGEGGRLDGIIVFRAGLGELEPEQEQATEVLELGLVNGVASSGAPVVAVERSDTDPSAIPFFAPLDVSSVDSIDLTSGRTALVFALLGAEGNFGIKGTANALLPELLQPAAGASR